jgi:site-specific DNA-methyltransferase (adenine-specific)
MTNVVLNVDCLEGMKLLPDNSVDLTVTSPPYDELRLFKGNTLPMPKVEQVANEVLRITKPGGVVVWVIQEQIKDGSQSGTSSEQRLHFRKIGFRLFDRLIMARYGHRVPAKRRYGRPLEEAFILSKGEPTTVNLWRDKPNKYKGMTKTARRYLPNGERDKRIQRWTVAKYGRRPNIWRYATGVHTAEEKWVCKHHPALMPEKMAEDLILCYSGPDDLVFDPFCGLATTCKMALLNHRRYLGIEIDEKYHRLAERRMKLAHLKYRHTLDSLLLSA